MENMQLENCRRRLYGEAWIRAFFFGGIFGGGALALAGLLFWMFDVKQIWWLIPIFVGVTAITACLLFFIKFKPTEKDVAMRIDALGFEERMLTMQALKGEQSIMAELQRQDAQSQLSAVNPKLLKIALSIAAIVWLCVSVVGGAAFTTVSVLSANDVIKSGKELYAEWTAVPPVYYSAFYTAEEGGYLDGEDNQKILVGTNGQLIIAVAQDEFVFVGWSDGMKTPYRTDKNVKSNISVKALFRPIDAGDGDIDPKEETMGMPEPDRTEDGMSQSTNPKPTPNPPDMEWIPSNMIINGEIYYGDATFDAYYQMMLDELAKNDQIPEDLKQIIDAYFGAIEQ